MRAWRSGALFEFLNTTKRSVSDDDSSLARAADVLVVDGAIDVEALHATNPALVVVTISPFGIDGPWAGRAATEFTLQAWCGSTGSRGLPEEPPLAAGGRIGEWITGSFAAVAALAAVRDARRSGRGAHVDVSMLDCMAVTMVSYPTVHAAMAGWPPEVGPSRVVEIPSVEPTADGYVVVTTNSAQQYDDFMVQIGRADVLENKPELAQRAPRWERRDEYEAMVHEYTTARSTAQVLEDAELLRVPCAPVHNGATLPKVDHFVERGVYVSAPSGRFVQPRIPYTIGDIERRPFEPAPSVGEHSGTIGWEPRPTRTSADAPRRPLEGLRVVDCTAWWAGPAATHVLASLGADVIKVESVTRPDLMRYTALKPPSAELWWEWGGLFHGVNSSKRAITLDLRSEVGIELFHRLLDTADALIDNYTPRVMEQFGLTWGVVHERHPHVVMTRMPAFGLDGPWRDRTGFAQQMEGISGMAWLTGYPDGLPVLVRGACDPLAALHAVLATLAALEVRDRTGEGVFVETTMIETALNVAAEQVIEYCVSGEVLHRGGARGPTAAPQGVYQCPGDDRWVAIAVATDEHWAALRGALGDPEWARDASLATVDGRRAARRHRRGARRMVRDARRRRSRGAPLVGGHTGRRRRAPARDPAQPAAPPPGFVRGGEPPGHGTRRAPDDAVPLRHRRHMDGPSLPHSRAAQRRGARRARRRRRRARRAARGRPDRRTSRRRLTAMARRQPAGAYWTMSSGASLRSAIPAKPSPPV